MDMYAKKIRPCLFAFYTISAHRRKIKKEHFNIECKMSRSSTLHIKPTFRKFFTSYTCLQTTFIHLGYSAH